MEIGYLLDHRFRILSFISEGSTALVYRAYDEVLKRDVAIKMMRDDFLVANDRYENFAREADYLASLRHINIIRIYGFGYDNRLPYLVVELAKGKTLSHLLETHGRFRFQEAKAIMKQLLAAIIFTHQCGLLHRDIKPQNIFYGADGSLKISDFGIAIALQNEVFSSSKVYGSLPYLAPEVIQGQSPSVQSDIYALGITFYEILTGHLPFNGESVEEIAKMHISHSFPSLKKDNIVNYEEIDSVLRKACAKNPLDRYKDAESMLEDLSRIEDGKKTKKKSWFRRLWRF